MPADDPGAVASVLPSSERPIRAAEVIGALSLATDLGTGQPPEHALRTAVLRPSGRARRSIGAGALTV